MSVELSGILPVNKAAGMTSHDVISSLRRITGIRRIGHCGTLDEMATGVLPVCIGRATRAADYVQAKTKVYHAGIAFGKTSTTQDIWGEILTQTPSQLTEKEILDAFSAFTGPVRQIPPMYSAIKQNGKKLYELARKGMEVPREPREITVYGIKLLSFSPETQEGVFSVECSKGTYVRTLCHDIGVYLGVGAVMNSLTRTRNGAYCLEDCKTLEEVASAKETGRLEGLLFPVESVFADYPRATLSPKEEEDMRTGRHFSTSLTSGDYAAFSGTGEFICLGKASDGVFSLIKSFYDPSAPKV